MKTINRIIEIELSEVQSPEYDNNIERYGDHSDTCLICGKRTLNKNPKYVHYTKNGTIISYAGDDLVESQGFFPVGKECAKKLVINFTF